MVRSNRYCRGRNRKSFILPRGVPAVVSKMWNKGKEVGSDHREFRVGKSFVGETELAMPGAAALAEFEDRLRREDEELRIKAINSSWLN